MGGFVQVTGSRKTRFGQSTLGTAKIKIADVNLTRNKVAISNQSGADVYLGFSDNPGVPPTLDETGTTGFVLPTGAVYYFDGQASVWGTAAAPQVVSWVETYY